MIAVALAIVLPLTLIKYDTVPEISFDKFDRLSDYSVTVTWKKLRKTPKYTVEFCYGNINENSVKSFTTEETSATITRQTGILSVRVKGNAEFSEWKSIDIPPLKLKAPATVVISESNMKVSWSAVYYDFYGVRTEVSRYKYDVSLTVGGETLFDVKDLTALDETETDPFATFIKLNVDKIYQEGLTPWENLVFTVRVKATVDPKFSASASESEKYLKGAYTESSYTETSITITKDIYEGM